MRASIYVWYNRVVLASFCVCLEYCIILLLLYVYVCVHPLSTQQHTQHIQSRQRRHRWGSPSPRGGEVLVIIKWGGRMRKVVSIAGQLRTIRCVYAYVFVYECDMCVFVVYVYMYVYMYVCVHLCVCVYVYVRACMYVYIRVFGLFFESTLILCCLLVLVILYVNTNPFPVHFHRHIPHLIQIFTRINSL